MSTTSNEHDIDASLRKKLNDYFSDLGDSTPVDMYDMVLQVFEKPLLEEVMAATKLSAPFFIHMQVDVRTFFCAKLIGNIIANTPRS